MISVNQPIDGISLNGTEVLLDYQGNVMLFNSIEDAKQFLLDSGYPEDAIDDNIIFKEEQCLNL